MSGVRMMQLDKKAIFTKDNEIVNEYYYLDSAGQKVLYNKKPVKIQTKVHKIRVSSLAQPNNNIRQQKPSKKQAKQWFISSRQKKVASKAAAFRNLIQAYSSQICTSKLVHWVRTGLRFEGVSKEEMKNVSEEETFSNNVAIYVGVRNSKVKLSDIPCLVPDDSITSNAFVQEYFLVDSEKNKIKIKDQCVKVQTRALRSRMKSKSSKKKGTEFFVSVSKKKIKSPEKKQNKREVMNNVVKEFYKMLVTSRDVHYVKVDKRWKDTSKLSEDEQRNNLAIVMALSNKDVSLSNNKWLRLDTNVQPNRENDFVNEYFLVNDSGKNVECQGYPIKSAN
eukprot:UN07034